VGIELNVLTKQCLNRRRGQLSEVMEEVEAWQNASNNKLQNRLVVYNKERQKKTETSVYVNS
jgi:hypothetical protein